MTSEIKRPNGMLFLYGIVPAIVLGYMLFVLLLEWSFFLALVPTAVASWLGFHVALGIWQATPDGRIWTVEQERLAYEKALEEARQAELAHQAQLDGIRSYIIAEYRERAGDPYAEVPQAWLLYRWSELEKQGQDDVRHDQLMAQQQALASAARFLDVVNTQRVIGAVHEGPQRQYH